MGKGYTKTYFTVGRDAGSGVFVDRKASSTNTRVMNSTIFEKALKQADGKFLEITSERGKRGASVKHVVRSK